MKLVTIVFFTFLSVVLFCTNAFCQTSDEEAYQKYLLEVENRKKVALSIEQGEIKTDLAISGQIVLKDNDVDTVKRLGLLTKLYSTDSIKTRVFDIPKGRFTINNLRSGIYRLTFQVHEDYWVADTIVALATGNLNGVTVSPKKRSCDYNATVDITNNSIKIIIATANGFRSSSKHDRVFEEKFEIRYLILPAPGSNLSCLKKYNEKVFQHLDKKFGGKWRKNVRVDALAFNETYGSNRK